MMKLTVYIQTRKNLESCGLNPNTMSLHMLNSDTCTTFVAEGGYAEECVCSIMDQLKSSELLCQDCSQRCEWSK